MFTSQLPLVPELSQVEMVTPVSDQRPLISLVISSSILSLIGTGDTRVFDKVANRESL